MELVLAHRPTLSKKCQCVVWDLMCTDASNGGALPEVHNVKMINHECVFHIDTDNTAVEVFHTDTDTTAVEVFHTDTDTTAVEVFHTDTDTTAVEVFHIDTDTTAVEVFHNDTDTTAVEVFHKHALQLVQRSITFVRLTRLGTG